MFYYNNAVQENLRRKSLVTDKAMIYGRMEDDFHFSHEILGEKFYRTRVVVERYSDKEDFVPILVSEKMLKYIYGLNGRYVEVKGRFCSENWIGDDNKNHLDLYLLARSIRRFVFEDKMKATENFVYLDGYVCKVPNLRKTQRGKLIVDLLIAVNVYNESYYIPCIAWERDALNISEMEVGSNIKIKGRIQSREYFKRFSPDSEEGEYKFAYEISIAKLLL